MRNKVFHSEDNAYTTGRTAIVWQLWWCREDCQLFPNYIAERRFDGCGKL